MSLPTGQMPLTTYADLKLTKAEESEIKTECFPEVTMSKVIHTALKEPIRKDNNTPNNCYHCQGCQPNPIYIPMDVCYVATDILDHCLHCKSSTSASGFALKRGGNFNKPSNHRSNTLHWQLTTSSGKKPVEFWLQTKRA